jgi:hypothetical protein
LRPGVEQPAIASTAMQAAEDSQALSGVDGMSGIGSW